MFTPNIDAAVAEMAYRQDRIATDYRHAASVGRVVRWHLHRRTNRQRVF